MRTVAVHQRELLADLHQLAERLSDFGERLDPAIGPAEVSAALRDASRLRVNSAHLLDVLKALPFRACAHCGTAINGRADRRYCSGACRVAARRASG